MQPITRPVVAAMVSVMPAAFTACGTLIAARPRNAVSVIVARVDVFQMLTCVRLVAPVLNAADDVQEMPALFTALHDASAEGCVGAVQVIA
jgi:hypothetical protein